MKSLPCRTARHISARTKPLPAGMALPKALLTPAGEREECSAFPRSSGNSGQTGNGGSHDCQSPFQLFSNIMLKKHNETTSASIFKAKPSQHRPTPSQFRHRFNLLCCICARISQVEQFPGQLPDPLEDHGKPCSHLLRNHTSGSLSSAN